MKKIIDSIEIKNIDIEMLEAYFEDYKAKQDLITMIFDLHKFDEDASILESEPFKHYEKAFAVAKIKYDTIMNEIQEKVIPNKYKKSNCQFEVNFEDKIINIFTIED